MISVSPGRRGVWITRAEPGASVTATRVAALGLNPLVAPLLSFRPIEADLTLGPNEALAFTSISGVTRAAALSPLRHMPVYAVGDATAEAARRAGYRDVASAGGDVQALAALISRSGLRGGVVHPCATQTAGDLVGALRALGVEARATAVYQTVAEIALPAPVAAALRDRQLQAALFHSPKAARTAADLLGAADEALCAVTAAGMSLACVAPLQACGFGALIAAPSPTEDALLEVLAQRGRRRP